MTLKQTVISQVVYSNKNIFKKTRHFIKNKTEITFNTALTDWGYISGVAILDSSTYGSGNLLMFSQLANPRQIFIGDNIKFDINSLEISVK